MANYINHINIGNSDYHIKDTTHPEIKFYYPTGTAAKTSSPYYCSRWDVTDTEVTSYVDGMMVWLEVPVAGNGTYGTGLQINSLGYKPVVYNVNSMVSTRYGVGARIWCIYNSTQTGSLYLNASSATTVTGCWQIMDYDSNTTMTYGTIQYYFRPYAGQAIYRYKFVAQGVDNRVYPIVTTNQSNTTQVAKTPTTTPLRPWKIWWYNTTTTISAGAVVGANTLMETGYSTTAVYNFNESTDTYKMIYLVGDYNKDTDLFTLYNDGSSPCTSYYLFVPNNTANINLSSYFTEGKYYWLLGASYSTTDYFSLFGVNPLYYFDGTNLIPVQTQVANELVESSTNGVQDVTVDGESIVNALKVAPFGQHPAVTDITYSSFTPKTGISVTSSFTAIKTLATSSFTPKTGISVTSSANAITSLATASFTPKTGVSVTNGANNAITSLTTSSVSIPNSITNSSTENAITSLATTSFTPKTGVSVTSSITAITGLSSVQITPVTKNTVMTSATYASGVLTFSTGDSVTEGTAVNVANYSGYTTASALQTVSLTNGTAINYVTGVGSSATFLKGVALSFGSSFNVATGVGASEAFAKTVSLTDGTAITYVSGVSASATFLKTVALTDGTAITYATGAASTTDTAIKTAALTDGTAMSIATSDAVTVVNNHSVSPAAV